MPARKPIAVRKTFIDTGPNALNFRQREFIRLMMETEQRNPLECAQKAGYGGGSASVNQLLRNPKVKFEILKQTKERNERCAMNADKLLLNLVKVMETCMQKVPFKDNRGQEVADDDGKPVLDMVDKRGAIAAATQIGKHVDIQAWREPDQNVNVQHNNGGIDVSKLDEDECRMLMSIVLKARAGDDGDDAPKRIESQVVNQDGTDAT